MTRSKLLLAALALIATGASRSEDRLSSPAEFFGVDKSSGYTQAVLGSAETVIGAVVAHSALRGPRTPTLRSATGVSHRSAFAAVDNARGYYRALRDYQAGRGAGVIRSVKLLGASVAFIDAAGRLYEWNGTDAEPSWSPVYSYLSKVTGTKLESIPEISDEVIADDVKHTLEAKTETKAAAPVDKAPAPGQSEAEKALRVRLESRLAKINPHYRREIEAQLHESDQAAKAAKAAIPAPAPAIDQKAKAETHGAPDRFQSAGDFFRNRPTAEDTNLAQAVMFGGDLVGSTLLVRSLLTRQGLDAVRSAEEALKAAKALTPEGKAGTEAIASLDRWADSLEARARSAGAANDATLHRQLTAEASGIRTQAQAMRNATVPATTRLRLIEMAMEDVNRAREMAVKTANTGKFVKGVKVIGTGLLVMDALGRFYEWRTGDANPRFSPALTWLAVNSEKSAEEIWKQVSPHVGVTRDAFMEQYDSIRNGK